jgi:hypothetical protein
LDSIAKIERELLRRREDVVSTRTPPAREPAME